jgi:hypothetical protein
VSDSNCCAPYTVHLFPRKADGTFAPRRDVTIVPPDELPQAVKVFARGHSRPHLIDWDRDGRTDLVSGTVRGWTLHVGAGPLAGKDEVPVRPFPVPEVAGAHPLHVAFADWDGDGSFDLLTLACRLKDPQKGPWLYDIYWSRNAAARGVPRFGPPARVLSVPEPWEVNGFAVLDRGRAGRQDLVVSLTRGWDRKPDGGWTCHAQLWLYRRGS